MLIKSIEKHFTITFLILISGILLGTLLLTVTYALPVAEMQENVARSSEIYNYEGVYPQLINGYKMSQMDNNTDAIMLANAIRDGNESALVAAMKVRRVGYSDKDLVLSLTNYANKVEGDLYEVSYERYWHGYLIFLKPLLLFFDIGDIRMLSMYVQIILMILLLFTMFEKGLKKYIPAIVGIYLVMMPPAINLCFQFMTIYYIMMVALIILISKYEVWKDKIFLFPIMFLLIGMITSYLDFLTYPLVTLGMPLIMLIILRNYHILRKAIVETVQCMIMWGIGYLGMWIGKWVMYYLITHENMFEQAMNQILLQTSASEDNKWVVILQAVYLNLKTICKWPVIILFGIMFVFYLLKIIRNKKREFCKATIIPLLLISLVPFFWYMIASTHSQWHYWFTYRELIITVFAGLCILIYLSDIKNKDQI